MSTLNELAVVGQRRAKTARQVPSRLCEFSCKA